MTVAEASVLDLVHRFAQIGAEQFGRRSVDGITPRQLSIMQAISAAPGASQAALISTTRIDRSTLSAVIRSLEQRGLVTRGRRNDDMRAYRVRLTPPGEQALRLLTPVRQNVEQSLLRALTPQERSQLVGFLRRITHEDKAAIDDNPAATERFEDQAAG